MGELDKVAGHIDHAVVFVHDHHAAGAHDGADLRQALVIDRRIEHIDGNAAAGRSAGLHGFDAAAGHGALADVVDEALQRGTQRHLHQTGVLNLAHQRKDLGSRTLLAAGLGKPCGAASDDGSNVVPGFDVVDVGRLAVQTLLRGIRRARTRTACAAFEGCDKSCLLAANKGSRALHQLNVEVEAAVQNIHSQQPVLARLFNGPVEPAYRQRILGAHINNSISRAHHICADHHAFQQRMRIALNLVAVHVSAGIAFIGVADDVLRVGLGLGQEIPLIAGEEARAAAPAQPGGLDLLDDSICAAVDQHLVERLVAAHRNVLLNVRGIDEAAVAQNDLLLPLEERNRVPGSDLRVALSVFDDAR